MYKCSVTCLIEGPDLPSLVRQDRVAATPVAALILAVDRLLKDVTLCQIRDDYSKGLVTLVATVIRIGGSQLDLRAQERRDDEELERAEAMILRESAMVQSEEINRVNVNTGG